MLQMLEMSADTLVRSIADTSVEHVLDDRGRVVVTGPQSAGPSRGGSLPEPASWR
ncbi:MAG TPA: hypothetical protein VHG70_12475 [Nocardioidaceae bacterium]|nr:hypothetical protein [Nocardioidaceae bacterium]